MKKLQKLVEELKGSLFERDDEIEGILAAILSDTNLLLLGPPGTAKSLMARLVCKAFDGKYFEWLVHKFTTPEDLFGPISLKSMEQDVYRRVTTGKLPESNVAFVDEIWKSSDAVLNTLLTIVNEKVFHNNGVPTKVPLLTMVGASNELPEGDSLAALYDRFILRYWVRPLQDESNFLNLLKCENSDPKTKISLEELEKMKDAVSKVKVSNEVLNTLLEIKNDLKTKGITSSDRRWKMIIKVLCAVAYLRGRDEISQDDFDVLCNTLWDDPKEQKTIMEIVAKYANPLKTIALDFADAAEEVYALWKTSTSEAEEAKDNKAEMAATIEASSTLKEIIGAISSEVSKNKDHPGVSDLSKVLDRVRNMQKDVAKSVGIV